jgi:hypothetical protein
MDMVGWRYGLKNGLRSKDFRDALANDQRSAVAVLVYMRNQVSLTPEKFNALLIEDWDATHSRSIPQLATDGSSLYYVQAPAQGESTLDLLNRLFREDPRLARTKPAREYRVDPEKWARWQSLAEPELKNMVRYVEYHFNQWLASLAKGIDDLLLEMEKRDCDIYVSTGISETREQSASELWMFYIFNKVLEAKGKRIEPFNEFWSILRKGQGEAPCRNLLIIDDFVRTGTHLTIRMAKTPDLFRFLAEQKALLYVLTPIMVLPDIFYRSFDDVITDQVGPAEVDRIRDLIRTRTVFLTGIYYDIDAYPYIVIDHNGSDKYDSEIAGGNIGKGRMIGPLLEGDSVENLYRYPPPLYHLEFGNGKLPLKVLKFRSLGDGFYSLVF